MSDVEFVRVTDDVKPKREYTIPLASFDEKTQTKVDKPAVSTDGSPLPVKYTPSSLSGKSGDSAAPSGQQAENPKEK